MTAQQDRTRILAEAAGEAAERLAALVTAYEQAVEAGTAEEAAAAEATRRALVWAAATVKSPIA